MKNVIYLSLLACCFIPKYVNGQSPQKTVVPFSNYLVDSNLVFLSGQIGVKSADDPQENFKIEVKQTIENVSKYLKNAGSSLNKVISVTVYLKDMDHFAEFNEIYKEYFQAPFPVRTCIGIQDLVMNANIEMTVIARLK